MPEPGTTKAVLETLLKPFTLIFNPIAELSPRTFCNQRGEAIISPTRQPNTSGVDGTGTRLERSIKAVGPGTSKLAIVQVNARDSKQRSSPLVSSEATIRVQ